MDGIYGQHNFGACSELSSVYPRSPEPCLELPEVNLYCAEPKTQTNEPKSDNAYRKGLERGHMNNWASEMPLGAVWGGKSVYRPYYYLIEVERLFRQDPQSYYAQGPGKDLTTRVY